MINYGTRNGGGIGEVLPTISYKTNVGMFFARFFYDLIFYILIILFLGNIFLGIIVDTFADLRDRNTARMEDINNVCYICQLTRDDSLKYKIDFKTHTKEDHYVWNYVYFLTYLYTSNSNDFNPLESNVWKKLSHCDISWIPLESNNN